MRKLIEKIRAKFSKKSLLVMPDVSKNEAVFFCKNDFSTCVHQSFDKCTLKEKCTSQK